MVKDATFTLFYEQNGRVHVEIHVIPSALRREALAMTSSRLVDLHALECAYVMMALRQHVYHVLQRPLQSYVSRNARCLGYAWPYKKHVHPLIQHTASSIYAQVVVEFLPLRLIYDLDAFVHS